MSIKSFLWSLLFCLFLSTPVAAQRHRQKVVEDTIPALLRQYQDSLSAYKHRLDSLERELTGKSLDSKYYKLFVPLTFYNGISHDMFSLGMISQSIEDQEINNSLLDMCFRRPDLVRSIQTELDNEAANLEPETHTNVNVSTHPSHQVSVEKSDQSETMPVDIVVKKPNFWSFGADTYLQVLQNYVSTNWYQGGQSNYSLVSSVTLQANYNNKQKVKWDNKLEMKIGFQTSREDTVHSVKTSEDLLRYTGKFGLQATKRWYYTLQAVGQTQFTKRYNKNSRTVTADFFAPVQLNVSLGMDYNVEWLKKRLTGTIHLAPFAYNLKYVNREYLASRNGIEEGHKVKNDYGSQFTVDLTWKIADNIKWKTRLYGYTTYERVEFQAENNFSFQFSKYISTNVFVYPRFDDSTKKDDHHGYWQYKEYASFGFTYSF